jgi:hypothetical protein
VIIRLPKGGYTPEFERRVPAASQGSLPSSKRMAWRMTMGALAILIVVALVIAYWR